MNEQQQQFVDFYCGEANFNATRAAELAKYAAPRQEGWRLKQRAEIRAAIDERLAAAALSTSEITARWTDIASATMQDFYVRDPGAPPNPDKPFSGKKPYVHLDLDGAYQLGKFHLVKQIKQTKYGPEVILYDKMVALDRLARVQGMLSELPGKKLEGLLDAILNALPDELREQVRQHVVDALAEAGSPA